MVPLQVFPGYPPTVLSTYRVLLPRSLAFTITLVLIRTVVVVVVVVVVNINILPVAERNKLLILLVVPAVFAVIYILKTTSWPEQGFDVSKQRDGHPPTALVYRHGPSVSFSWVPTYGVEYLQGASAPFSCFYNNTSTDTNCCCCCCCCCFCCCQYKLFAGSRKEQIVNTAGSISSISSNIASTASSISSITASTASTADFTIVIW